MKTSSIKIKGKEYKTVFYGNLHYLYDPKDWGEDWVEYVMKGENIEELNEDQKEIIKILREFQENCGVAPEVSYMNRVTKFSFKEIYELFPSGPSGACRIAGLQRNRGY